MDLDSSFNLLKVFFEKPICQKAAAPLKNGSEVAIQVGDLAPFTLLKDQGHLFLAPSSSSSPDLSFFVGSEIPLLLNQINSDEIGEVGISVFNWMLEKEENKRISVKIHLDSFSVVRKGYLGVLALGGIPLMQYLATKGLGNVSKIKNALIKLQR